MTTVVCCERLLILKYLLQTVAHPVPPTSRQNFMIQFDLTTIPTGLNQVKSYVEQCVTQVGGLTAGVIQAITDVNSSVEAQTKAAIAIITAGKENNLAEMELIMTQKAGLALGNCVNGIPIEAVVGKASTIVVKVKYK